MSMDSMSMLEVCPKCKSIFIEWRGEREVYQCLVRACGYEWVEWKDGPQNYDSIKNIYLQHSLYGLKHLPHLAAARSQ